MTTSPKAKPMGPLGQAVQQFIALLADGREAEAAAARLKIAGMMTTRTRQLAESRGIPEQRASLFVFLNALKQVMENCPDELIAARARFLHDNLIRNRYAPDPPRMRQHASRQAAARTGVGRNYRRS